MSNSFLIADPRRIEKICTFEFPQTKKQMHAFLGLTNSLRRVVSLNVVSQMSILTPLTSSKNEFKPTEKQISAFNSIKSMLTEKPLFANLIDEMAEKILFVDAASSTGILGGVLAQKKKGIHASFAVPTELNLENKIHRIIYDKKLPYVPAMLFTSLPIDLPKPSLRKTVPPNIGEEPALLGFTEQNVVESFFYSTISILALYGCKSPGTPCDLKKFAVKQLKKGVLANKLKDFCFNLDTRAYNDFLDNFLKGKVSMDPDLLLVQGRH